MSGAAERLTPDLLPGENLEDRRVCKRVWQRAARAGRRAA